MLLYKWTRASTSSKKTTHIIAAQRLLKPAQQPRHPSIPTSKALAMKAAAAASPARPLETPCFRRGPRGRRPRPAIQKPPCALLIPMCNAPCQPGSTRQQPRLSLGGGAPQRWLVSVRVPGVVRPHFISSFPQRRCRGEDFAPAKKTPQASRQSDDGCVLSNRIVPGSNRQIAESIKSVPASEPGAGRGHHNSRLVRGSGAKVEGGWLPGARPLAEPVRSTTAGAPACAHIQRCGAGLSPDGGMHFGTSSSKCGPIPFTQQMLAGTAGAANARAAAQK
jgi:hypothetical protein